MQWEHANSPLPKEFKVQPGNVQRSSRRCDSAARQCLASHAKVVKKMYDEMNERYYSIHPIVPIYRLFTSLDH